MRKIQFWGILTALLATLTINASAASFHDVPNTSLAGEVSKAVEYGLMNGYNATTFGYKDQMTRAQFAAVLVRMMGWEMTSPESASLADVPASHTWYKVVETALAHDVIDEGVDFRPGSPITRAEMAEMLVRALGLKEAASQLDSKAKQTPFTDVQSKRGYITIAYQIGMTKGTTATTFSPDATATRAQAAAMLVRMYEKIKTDTDFVHGFYAISSYNQLELAGGMEAVSAGWSRMTWDGSTALLSTTSANGNEYNIPSGYQSVTDYLQKKNVPLHLSVFMDESSGVKALLASETGRKQAITQIINEVTVTYKTIGRNPYSGVTLDFEGLRNAQKTDYTAFVTALAAELDALNKTLYVCIAPATPDEIYYDGYDYNALGRLADKLIMMAYDYDARDMSTFVGTDYYKTAATAPIDQVYYSLWQTVKQVDDPDKILLGFSCKNTAWKIDSNGKLLSGTPLYPTTDTVAMRLAQNDTEFGWSDAYQQSYAIYTAEDGSRYFLWYQNDASITTAVQTAKLLGVHGASLWRLGSVPTGDSWNWNTLLRAQ